MMRIAIVLLVVAAANLAAAEEPFFGVIGEAFTSGSEHSGIRGGWRMFTTPYLDDYCPSLPRVARLVVREPITLTKDVWFPYSNLVVVARDESGRVIPHVPISIEVEDQQPPLLATSAVMLAGDRVLPIAPGTFHFRFSTLCGERVVSRPAKATARPSKSGTPSQRLQRTPPR